jgi:hypothetical protein
MNLITTKNKGVMPTKTGFDNGICTECAYNTKGRCSICKSSVKYIKSCPENYSYELMREIAEDICRRRKRMPHGDVLSREW